MWFGCLTVLHDIHPSAECQHILFPSLWGSGYTTLPLSNLSLFDTPVSVDEGEIQYASWCKSKSSRDKNLKIHLIIDIKTVVSYILNMIIGIQTTLYIVYGLCSFIVRHCFVLHENYIYYINIPVCLLDYLLLGIIESSLHYVVTNSSTRILKVHTDLHGIDCSDSTYITMQCGLKFHKPK